MRSETPAACVLLVDDDPLVLEAYTFVLERALPVPVVTASDAYEALALLRGEPSLEGEARVPLRVGAVVVDIDMPGMNGLELLRELVSVLPAEVPRGICSARRAVDGVDELRVSFVVRKSGSTRELVDALTRALSSGEEDAARVAGPLPARVGGPSPDAPRRTGEFQI